MVCHGIPGPRALKEGDILNIDVTFIVDGWHGDSSRMYGVGKIARAAERLLEVTYNALMRGVAAVRPGATTGDIGAAIQTYAEGERCSVVRDFCGHGLGRVFHDRPNILHYGEPGEGLAAQARHAVHHRADDQSRQAAGEDPVRRLDRGHPRPVAVGAVRAHGRRHRDGMPGVHPLPQGSGPATTHVGNRARLEWASRMRGKPHYLGHRERLRRRFREAGADALPDYELLELILFRAVPRRDTKPLAKAIIAQFGTFAEALNAPEER